MSISSASCLSASSRVRIRLLPVVCAAFFGLLSLPPGAGATIATPNPVVLGTNTTGITEDSGGALDNFATRAGVMPKMAMYYQDWYEGWSTALLDPRIIDPILARGAVPMITWEPRLDSQNPVDQSGYAPARIAAGAYDPYIRRAAREAAAFGQPFFLRFAHEMNGSWYQWGANVDGNTPEDYIAMWRHVVAIFREEGATNVRWVWSPNVYGSGGVKPFAPYYPGNRWVDFVALDGYNWGSTEPPGWQSFAKIFGLSYSALAALTTKPMMIAETASAEAGGDKASWTREILTVLPAQMPRVRALVWFDQDKETDWRIDSSPATNQAFRELAASPLFSGGVSRLLNPTAAEGTGSEPMLRIHNTSAAVGKGAHAVAFVVKSSSRTTRRVTARYALRSGADRGVRAGRGPVTIPAGARTGKFKIWVVGRLAGVSEPQTRHIWVKLYGVNGARLASRFGRATIHYR